MNMLRSIREKKGLTVSQLAARASIPARVLSEYEDGLQPIPLPHAKLIAKALWVPIEDLMPPAGSVPPLPQQTSSVPYQPQQMIAVVPPPAVQAPPAAPSAVSAQAMPQPPSAISYERPRTYGPTEKDPKEHERRSADNGRGGEGRTTRPSSRPVPPPPGPISEGQMEELLRLTTRLEIDQEQLEKRIGKSLSMLTKPEAKEWIKRVRAMADEVAPTRKVHFGQWPEGREDREAAYLREQQDANAPFVFTLFNGERFNGVITDFTPYTITINHAATGEEVVLRKLAIVYYRRTANGDTQAGIVSDTDNIVEAAPKKAARPRASTTKTANSDKTTEVAAPLAEEHSHQPVDTGLDSDRVGEPVTPEKDNMDEDRGV
ncbi:MAG: helix-turn-helix transcriptional regulator [Chloroflexi bacterium]|nr:helix-turn-helix transcriptional regulator [Chloroflexota bacterium]